MGLAIFRVYQRILFREDGCGFLPACRSDTGVRLSTRSWFDKVAMRHSHAYHPLLNVQAWIRLPVGLTYALMPAAGAGIMVGGCMVDAAVHGKGGLCQLSVVGGVAVDADCARCAGRRATA